MDARYITGEYQQKNPTWHAEDAPWKASQIKRMLQESRLEPRSICDVGCGSGDILNELALAMPECLCVGYDVSPQALEMAKPKTRENLQFQLGQPADKARYDLALAIDVFEHVENYIGFIRGLANCADQVVFHIPLDLSVQSVLRASPLSYARETVGHLHYFSKETELATLAHAGMFVERWFYTASHAHKVRLGASLTTTAAALPRSALFRVIPDLTVRILGGYSLLALCRPCDQPS